MFNYILNKFLRIFRIILRIFFKFDKWHIIPFREKKYPKEIIKYCNNNFRNKSFVEIGCGLGDIIRRIGSNNKLGLDIDQNVLNAASFLAFKKVSFKRFSFIDNVLIGNFDVIILVNWIHEVDPVLLKSKIESFFINNLNNNGVIILDTVQSPGYKYNHDINFLTDKINCNTDKIYEETSGNLRSIYIIKK